MQEEASAIRIMRPRGARVKVSALKRLMPEMSDQHLDALCNAIFQNISAFVTKTVHSIRIVGLHVYIAL